MLSVSYDATPSVLSTPITSSIDPPPSSKRAKLAEISGQSSIASLVNSKAYNTVDEFVRDVKAASARVVDVLQGGTETGKESHDTIQRQIGRASSMNDRLEALVVGEMLRRPKGIKIRKEDDSTPQDEHDTGIKVKDPIQRGKTILTLYGGEKEAKRLFTSLSKTESDLNEQALPNGITTTEILPTHSLDQDSKEKKRPKLGTVFAPPASTRPLNPPKQPSKHTATKSSSVNWYNPADATPAIESTPRDGYIKQPLSVGQWLKYNVTPSATQIASPEAKRKQRDRALSFGEPQSLLSEETIAIHNQAKGEALFRSVYSSFAPDRDDSGALVPEQQKNRMWWGKYGEKHYEALLDIKDFELQNACEPLEAGDAAEEDFDDEVIQKAIETWQPTESMSELVDNKASQGASDRDADDLLNEISDLIETLNSHQRIRNLSSSSTPRSMPGQNPQLASISGSPSTPSSAETDVYETLKTQLALIVSALPPYMLSKLDGKKLGELQISTKIQLEGSTQKGTMNEDELSARTKPAARASMPASGPQTTTPYSGVPGRTGIHTQASTTPAQQYNRTAYGQNPISRSNTNPSSYPASQYPSRQPSSSQYPPSRPGYGSQGSYPPQRTPSSSYTDRYSNGVASQMHQSQSYSLYQNGHRPPMGQHTSSYGQQYATPQSRGAAASTYRPPGPQSEYAQRAPPPPAYNYGSMQAGGSRSPHQQQQPPHRSPFPGQGQTLGQTPSQRPPLYHQHSSHYGSQTSAEPPTNGTASNGSGRMSPDEQAALMARQKAQLAGQQASLSRQGSGTPQPVQGQYQQQNGTPKAQQNNEVAAN